MTDRWIAPDALFDGQTCLKGMAVLIVDGHVADIGTAPPDAQRVAGTITPGFVDLQVNGGGDTLLNNDPTAEGIATIAAAHRQFGTVALMPTLITDAPEVLDQAVKAIMTIPLGHIIGLHIEGPHIATAKRGTHAAAHIRPLDTRTIDAVAKLRSADVPVMITLAPEAATLDQITTLAAIGAVVSLGHSNATAAQTNAAIAAGAACATHLFNAMSPMAGRAPGMVGAVINSDVFSGIICDGHHVDDAMIALALRARPTPERVFAISDAMATVGGADAFDLYGQTIRVDHGRLINAEGNLAGAHTTLAQSLCRLVDHVGIPVDAALRMVTSIPATVIGRPDLGRLHGRAVADVLLLDESLRLTGTLAQFQPKRPT